LNQTALDELDVLQEESEDEEATPLEYDIAVYPADYTLEILASKLRSKEILMPKFQRAYVWTKAQASKLIESFMMGLPIPPIFLYIQPDQRYIIIDGRQRLETIALFFEGFFGEIDSSGRRRTFTLEGINEKSRWFGKTYAQFNEADQRKLKNSVLRAIIIKQLNPKKDDTSIYHIFERLNTGGTPLQDQEVRNCVYHGTLNDLLIELNSHPSWRKILGKPKSDPRQRDVQLILRYMSLFQDGVNYQKPMKEFLSLFMERNHNSPQDFLDQHKTRFKNTCDKIVRTLGERPFNPTGSLNPSVFDAAFVSFAKHPENWPADIVDRYTRLKADNDFKDYSSAATTDTEIVKNRLNLVERVLFS